MLHLSASLFITLLLFALLTCGFVFAFRRFIKKIKS